MPVMTLIKKGIDDQPVLLAGAASGILIIAALLFEHVGGLAPCKLCLTQRLPHYVMIGVAIISLIIPRPQFLWRLFGAMMLGLTALVGLQHIGVEQKWWQGPQGCSANLSTGTNLTDLTDSLLATPVIRCDEIAWSLFGISMAGWNFILSAALAFLLVRATFKTMTSQ